MLTLQATPREAPASAWGVEFARPARRVAVLAIAVASGSVIRLVWKDSSEWPAILTLAIVAGLEGLWSP